MYFPFSLLFVVVLFFFFADLIFVFENIKNNKIAKLRTYVRTCTYLYRTYNELSTALAQSSQSFPARLTIKTYNIMVCFLYFILHEYSYLNRFH